MLWSQIVDSEITVFRVAIRQEPAMSRKTPAKELPQKTVANLGAL
jgi:hypothetical protein